MASQSDIPWHMLKGLDPANSDVCTLKGSVTTGLEPSARDEIAVKLRSVAYCARGRVFFDVKVEQVPEALKLRSLDHIHVLVAVEPKFGFVKNKVLCLRRLRLLPRQLDWRKALGVWQRLSGFQGEPHTRRPDHLLEAIEVPVPSAGGDGPAPAPAPAAVPVPVPVPATAPAPSSGDPLREMLHSLRQPVKGTRPAEVAAKKGKDEPAAGQEQNGKQGQSSKSGQSSKPEQISEPGLSAELKQSGGPGQILEPEQSAEPKPSAEPKTSAEPKCSGESGQLSEPGENADSGGTKSVMETVGDGQTTSGVREAETQTDTVKTASVTTSTESQPPRAAAEPESGDSRSAAEPESGDSRTAAEPESGDSRPAAEPESGDSRPAAEPESGDSRPAVEPEGGDSRSLPVPADTEAEVQPAAGSATPTESHGPAGEGEKAEGSPIVIITQGERKVAEEAQAEEKEAKEVPAAEKAADETKAEESQAESREAVETQAVKEEAEEKQDDGTEAEETLGGTDQAEKTRVKDEPARGQKTPAEQTSTQPGESEAVKPRTDEAQLRPQTKPARETAKEKKAAKDKKPAGPESGETGDAPPAPAKGRKAPPAGAVSFRATCSRAGGGKQGHAFSSNEGAENFGGAVQELFDWRVQMKGYDLEVILDVAFDMVSVGLSLTPRALFYRNLARAGPTSLRSTVCFNLLMMAKPQPYEVVVDPMCGGGSISLEGAQAFPGTFHLCGDNYPDAAPRVALNREFSARQLSPTAELAVDVFAWDCRRLPLRDACADVIVTDLPFGKRLGSTFDNRTLYPACMEEMARICTPRYGRAVLLTQDKRTMEKTLHQGRIRSLWRCRASPHINCGGLDGCAYFLQRTDYVRRQRPMPSRVPPAPAAQRERPAAGGGPEKPAAPGPGPAIEAAGTGEVQPGQAATDDQPPTAADGSPKGAGEPPKGANVPPKGADESPKGGDVSPKGADGSPKGADVSPKGDDMLKTGDDTPPKGADVSPKGDDMLKTGDDTPPKGADVPPEGQVAGDGQTERKPGPGAEEAAAEGLTGDSQSLDMIRPEKPAPEGTTAEMPPAQAETASLTAGETSKPEEESQGAEDSEQTAPKTECAGATTLAGTPAE